MRGFAASSRMLRDCDGLGPRGGACFLASRAFTSKQATQVSLPYRGPKDGTTQLARRNGIYPLEVGLPTRRPDAKDVGNGAKLNMLADP